MTSFVKINSRLNINIYSVITTARHHGCSITDNLLLEGSRGKILTTPCHILTCMIFRNSTGRDASPCSIHIIPPQVDSMMVYQNVTPVNLQTYKTNSTVCFKNSAFLPYFSKVFSLHAVVFLLSCDFGLCPIPV